MEFHNTYYILRHGEALSNVKNIVSSWPETFENPLTDHGKEMIEESAQALGSLLKESGQSLDMIFASDMLRTRQTAGIIAQAFNVEVFYDPRLRELGFGVMNGGPISDLDKIFTKEGQRLKEKMAEGETYEEVLQRVSAFLKEIDGRYHGKTILIVSHECPLWILEGYSKGWTLEESFRNIPREARIHNGQVKKLG